MKACAGDVSWLSSHHVSNPSPLPLHDDGAHAILVAAGEKMLVGDDLGPEYSQDSSKVLGVEGGQFVKSLSVILQHSELYRRVESLQLCYSFSLVLVLYWDDLHTLFSIRKAFLALLR